MTIAVVTPDEARRDLLRRWTTRELTRLSQPQLTEIFLVTSADPVATPPSQLFFGPLWYEPARREPVSLLPPPVPPVAGKEVWPEEG